MSDGGSVSRWLEGLKAGEAADIERLWDRYFHRLVALAGTRLPSHARRDYDEEDLALSAFHSFCDRATDGRFPRLEDRDDLWRLLATITARKAIRTIRDRARKKRGGGRVLGESAIIRAGAGEHPAEDRPDWLLSREPTQESVVEFAEGFERLLDELGNPTLRTIALLRLEGHSSEEMARELGVSARTVDRKLQTIRELWGVLLE